MKRIICMLTVVALMATTACAQAPVKDYVVLNGTNVRLRLEPNLQCGWLKDAKGVPTYLKKGTKLEYTGEIGDFYEVTYNGQTLYVAKQFTYLQSQGKPAKTQPAQQSQQQVKPQQTQTPQTTVATAPASNGKPTVTLTGTNVRLRLGPSTSHEFLKNDDGTPCYLPKGTKLTKTGESGDFYKCTYNGHVVYVSKQFAK
ncbi:MAG: SH3 domain-containing protein [Bacteroidales bacterium]|nr:SH3 domain-containing protein [Bacteroidales bacterium]